MKPNNQGKTGPVNFKREMARRARLDKEEARRLHGGLKRGRPRKVGVPLDLTQAARTRARVAIPTEQTCWVCGLTFKSIRVDARLCGARCRKRASRLTGKKS
jgi:hypothetical protein